MSAQGSSGGSSQGSPRTLADGVRGFLGLRARGTPRPPRVEIDLGPAVPGAVVRLLPAAALLVAIGVVGSISGALWSAALVVGVLVVVRPTWHMAPVGLLLVGLTVFGGGDLVPVGGGDRAWRLAVALLAVHVMLRAAGVAASVPWRGVVEVAVLTRVARSLVAQQLAVQAVVLVVVAARTYVGSAGGGAEAARVVAVVAVAGLALLLVPREWWVRRDRDGY